VNLVGEPTKEEENGAKMAGIRNKGKEAEAESESRQSAAGREVIRTGRGSDYRVRERHSWAGRITKSTSVEVKSGKAKPSKLQEKTRKKHPGR